MSKLHLISLAFLAAAALLTSSCSNRVATESAPVAATPTCYGAGCSMVVQPITTCQTGYIVYNNGCVPAPKPVQTVTTCPSGYIVQSNSCVPAPTYVQPVTTCQTGYVTYNGSCTPATTYQPAPAPVQQPACQYGTTCRPATGSYQWRNGCC